MQDPLPADCAARFQARKLLATGGHGAVYLARQTALDRDVVVKLLHSLADPRLVKRFRAEAKLTAALAHPHIVKVLDHGADAQVPWIAYELLEGGSLRERVRRQRVATGEVLSIGVQIGEALAHAHAHGVLHRDIKPENILLGADGWKLADFGLAKELHAAPGTTKSAVVGTAPYMAPEQLRGEPATAASDVYALGVVLFEMCAGRLPFESANAVQAMLAQMNERPPRLSSAGARVPAALETLVDAMLSADPAVRPDARTLVARLRTTSASPVDPRVAREAVAGSGRRRSAVAAVAALSLVAGLLVLARRPDAAPPGSSASPTALVASPKDAGLASSDPYPPGWCTDPGRVANELSRLEEPWAHRERIDLKWHAEYDPLEVSGRFRGKYFHLLRPATNELDQVGRACSAHGRRPHLLGADVVQAVVTTHHALVASRAKPEHPEEHVNLLTRVADSGPRLGRIVRGLSGDPRLLERDPLLRRACLDLVRGFADLGFLRQVLSANKRSLKEPRLLSESLARSRAEAPDDPFRALLVQLFDGVGALPVGRRAGRAGQPKSAADPWLKSLDQRGLSADFVEAIDRDLHRPLGEQPRRPIAPSPRQGGSELTAEERSGQPASLPGTRP